MGQSASTPTTVTDVNEIPPPQFDADANAPPRKQHDRVIDFVREAPTATYTFDSRANRDDPDTELCRVNANGTKSCIRMDLNSKALFKSMQSLSFYCALPAEPTRTHMECNRLPQMSSR